MAKPPRKPQSSPNVDNRPRAVAARLLAKVVAGHSLTALFQEQLQKVAEKDQGLIKEICFGVTRYWPRLNALAEILLERPMKARDADVHALLLSGFYQLLYMRTAQHAAVAETVEASRSLKKPWAAGLINGVLRRFIREKDELLKRLDQEPASRYACPPWLLARLQKAWPDRWMSIVEAYNQRPPMTIRVNRSKISRKDYAQLLTEAAIPCRPVAAVSSALVLERSVDVSALPGFSEGLVSVQDAGAQLAAILLDVAPGQRILDACAAPGGKTGHILERAADIQLTAIDVDPQRLLRVTENLQRLGFNKDAVVCQGDAAAPAGEWSQVQYDRILLDVPCSATGVIRRHPDIKLLRRDSDIEALVLKQQEILAAIWPLLKPGGMLLYVTCSLLPEENYVQLERFLGTNPDARERPIEAAWGLACPVGRQTLPGESTMDGFYYACLEKSP